MKDENKKIIIEFTGDIIEVLLEEEFELFELFDNSMLDEILLGESEHEIDEHSHFGGEDSITSYCILGIIAWVSTMLADEGIILAKVILLEWMKDNKKKIYNKFNKKKYKKAIKIIEKYLEK